MDPKTFAQNGSACTMPTAWPNARSAIACVGPTSKNSARGRLFISSAVSISAAPLEVLAVLFRHHQEQLAHHALAARIKSSRRGRRITSRNQSPPSFSKRRQPRHVRQMQLVEESKRHGPACSRSSGRSGTSDMPRRRRSSQFGQPRLPSAQSFFSVHSAPGSAIRFVVRRGSSVCLSFGGGPIRD